VDFAKEKINATTYRFIKNQLEQQPRSSRGRRYMMEDKIFALSLMKQNPSGYRLLKKKFRVTITKNLGRHIE
jgi:hypothetical protein